METYWKKCMRKIKQHTAKKSSKTKQKKSLRKKMKKQRKICKDFRRNRCQNEKIKNKCYKK